MCSFHVFTICLHFQHSQFSLKIKIQQFVCIFQLFVYNFFSCLFTFLKIWIFAPKLSFSETFCHYGGLSPKLWNFEKFYEVWVTFFSVFWISKFSRFLSLFPWNSHFPTSKNPFFLLFYITKKSDFCPKKSVFCPKVWNLKIFLDF